MSAWQRIYQLPGRLNRKERLIAVTLLVLLVVIGIWQFNTWRGRASAPSRGGTMVEGLIGQPQLLNPLVSLDGNDRAILSLIYPGLTKTNADGLTEPVLAESWEMKEDGKSWRLTLKEGLKWHNGDAITTSDVAETIQRVVDPQQKSPYKTEWDNVTVEVLDDRNLIFHLPQVNAAFITLTDLPIVPLSIGSAELQQKLIGSGPYKYKVSTTSDAQITAVELVANSDWFEGEPFITNFTFRFFDTEDAALKAYRSGEINSLVLNEQQNLSGKRHEFTVQRDRAIFVNTSRDTLKDEGNRRKLLDGEKITDQTLSLVTPTSLAEYEPLTSLNQKWIASGQNVTVFALEPLALLEKIDAHDYDLVLAEIEMRADNDLYSLWHSTQKEDGLNLSQLDDKQIDEWLETARRTADASERRGLADKANERAGTIGAWRQLEKVTSYWYTQDHVKGIEVAEHLVIASDRFDKVQSWYLKTRVQ